MTTALDRVIVGNGGAAAEAALALRAAAHGSGVDLFADGRHPPYNPMLGAFYLSGALEGRSCFPFGDVGFYRRNGVRVHLRTPVARIEPETHVLTTAGGERFSYAQCLVATGSSTVVPPVPGLDGPGVFALRSFGDAVRLRGAVTAARVRAAAGAPPRALVLGASFAGVEVASVLRRAGLEVTLVEREAAVLPRAAHPACAALVERHLRALDHDLRLGCALTGVERRDARLLATLSGATEMFDMAVVCTGSRPNLGMLDGTGLTAADGIDVDERMRSAAPGLLAAGDVARTVDPLTGTRAAVPLWSNARRQGRAAGLAMAGVAASSPGCTPCNIQHAGELLFAAGGSLAAADVVEVDERGEQVEVLGFSGRRLVGFNLLGDVRRAGPLMCALGGERPTGARRSRGAAVPAALAAVREGMTWTTRNAG